MKRRRRFPGPAKKGFLFVVLKTRLKQVVMFLPASEVSVRLRMRRD